MYIAIFKKSLSFTFPLHLDFTAYGKIDHLLYADELILIWLSLAINQLKNTAQIRMHLSVAST